MLEVTIFETKVNLEIGTFDIASSEVFVGSVIFDDMEILSVNSNPSTGEDAIVTIRFI